MLTLMLNNIYYITALKRDIFTPCKHPKNVGTDGIAVHCSEMKMKKKTCMKKFTWIWKCVNLDKPTMGGILQVCPKMISPHFWFYVSKIWFDMLIKVLFCLAMVKTVNFVNVLYTWIWCFLTWSRNIPLNIWTIFWHSHHSDTPFIIQNCYLKREFAGRIFVKKSSDI